MRWGEKIFEIIERYDYRPNLIAKSMVTKKTQSIGVIIPDITNESFLNMIKGSEEIAGSRGSNLVICSTSRKSSEYMMSLENMLLRNVDGYLLLGAPDEETISSLLDRQKVVVVDRVVNSEKWPRVFVDHAQESYEMLKYLIEQGHRDIATITGPKSYILSSQRLNGYRQALTEAGIPYDEGKVFEANSFNVNDGQRAAERLLNMIHPTAVFCQSDLLAAGFYKACREKSISIPDDISVAGCDDWSVAKILYPELTTISGECYKLGATATEMLLDWIERDQSEVRNVGFESRIIIRNSIKPREDTKA